MRNIRVVDHNAEWVNMFEVEKKKLEMIFGDELTDIHHIGSTSVPGLKAKPVIDMMPVAKNINDVDRYDADMSDLGYEGLGENGIVGRRYFRKGGDDRTHHIHVFEEGSHDIIRHLAFRDYLRNHEDVRTQYGELKKNLAIKFPNDINGYMDGKHQFIKETEQKALEWYKNQDTK